MKLQESITGQMIITIPRSVCRALQLEKGDEFLVQINPRGNLELIKNKV